MFKVKYGVYLTLLFVIIGSLFGAQWNEASAHATLQAQTPAADSTVQEVPDAIELEYNEPVYTEYTTITVFDDEGNEVDTLEPNESGQSQKLTFDSSSLEDGTYAIQWDTVSLDGHNISGDYQFSVGESTAGSIDMSTPIYAQPFFWFGLIRFVFQGALLILTGLFIVNRFMSRNDAPTYELIPKYRSALWLLVMTAFSAGIVYLMTLPNDVIDKVLSLDFSIWIQFPFVISATAIMVVLILMSLRNMESIWYVLMAILLFVGLAVSGHVWTQSVPVYSIIIRTLHLAGISVWLGSFAYLVAYIFNKPDYHANLTTIKHTIFKLNVTAAIVIIATGLLMSIDATTITAIVTQPTTYTFLWFSKIALVIVLMLLGAYQTYQAMGKRQKVNRSILYIEVVLGLCLILAGVIMSQIEIPL
ncbi:copper resistance CopC/CopD family protein [Staphylococcus sp. 11261D007BR]